MTAPWLTADASGRARRQAARASTGKTRVPGYFFFLGFLTSFFGLLSLAMCDPPLQMDYTRCAGESEDREQAGHKCPVPWHRWIVNKGFKCYRTGQKCPVC